MEERGPGPFAEVLRRLRESRSLTQEELAERAGLTAKAVGALERGERRRPYPHTVRSLAHALGLDAAEQAELVSAVPRRGAGPAGARPTGGVPEGSAPAGEPTEPSIRVVDDPHPVASVDAGTGRVPVTPTVGREAEVDAVLALLAAGARLVTLTGPGGVGKTRLAQEVLARACADHPGGCAFVDLAPVREPATVVSRLAAALGVPDAPDGTTPTSLAHAVTGRRALVVLDNLEQVLAAAEPLADLVALAPDLTLLVTSRAPLRVRAEQEVPVAPLALPTDDGAEAVASSPAVRLLLERAAASGSTLQVTEGSAGVLAAICRRLDGIPLALELAAAATRLLPAESLLARLEDRGLDPALGGPRDLPDRQRTMTAVLDWSVDLLDPADAALLGRLAVFSGGFSLGSAEDVAADAAEDVAADRADDTLGGLVRLVEQSLVTPVASTDGEARFRLLEPVRQYAQEHLRDADSALATADAHATHFHRRALAAHRRLQRGGLGPVLDRLEADHANLRSAFLRLLELDRTGDAAELVGGVWLYLAIRGRAREGLAWLDRVGGAGSDEALLWASVGRMGLSLVVGDTAAVHRESAVALTLGERSDDPYLATEVTMLAGLGAAFRGDLESADRLLAPRDDLPGEERWWVAVQERVSRGQAALVAGRLDEADRHLAEALEGARALGNEFTLATALNVAANIAEVRGDDATAALQLGEALEMSARLRLQWTMGYSLPALAGVAGRVGDPVVAATLFGAAATLTASDDVDAHFPPARATADRGMLAARDALGEDRFREAWDAGRSATPEEVAELAAAVVADVTRRGRG